MGMLSRHKLFSKLLATRRFSQHKTLYFVQCAMATAVVFVILFVLNVIPNAVVIASIGASSFIVFTLPQRRYSQAKYVIGAYVIGLSIGTVGSWLGDSSWLHHYTVLYQNRLEFFGALAVGMTMLLMVITNLEHPPAASIALGLVLNEWTIKTVLVTFIAIVFICLVRYLLRRRLIDLR